MQPGRVALFCNSIKTRYEREILFVFLFVLVVPQLLLLLLAHVVVGVGVAAVSAGVVVVGNIEHLTSVAIESPIGQQKQLY